MHPSFGEGAVNPTVAAAGTGLGAQRRIAHGPVGEHSLVLGEGR